MFERAVKLYRHCLLSAAMRQAAQCYVSTRPSSRASSVRSSEADGLAGTQQFWVLDVPLGGQVLESSRAVLPRQVLVELVLQGVQTVAVAGAGAKLGDVKAGGVGHVDHESVGEDHQVVLLRKGKTNRLRQHGNNEKQLFSAQ